MVFVSCQFYLALFTVNSGSFSIFFIDLLVLESRNSFFWKSWNFQGCITVYLSKISDSFVAVVLSGNSDILSWPLSFVNNFFDFFKSFFQPKNLRFCGGFSYYHIVSCFVNNFLHLFFKAFTQWWKWRKKRNLNLLRFFFYFLLVVNGERGIWTLAPVARPTPLAGAPLQPLEYFSIIWKSSLPICYWRHFVTQKLLYIRSMCLSIAFFIIFLIVDIVYEYCRIASSIFVFTMSAISGVFNCLYSS